jgi:hypothetical protein
LALLEPCVDSYTMAPLREFACLLLERRS